MNRWGKPRSRNIVNDLLGRVGYGWVGKTEFMSLPNPKVNMDIRSPLKSALTFQSMYPCKICISHFPGLDMGSDYILPSPTCPYPILLESNPAKKITGNILGLQWVTYQSPPPTKITRSLTIFGSSTIQLVGLYMDGWGKPSKPIPDAWTWTQYKFCKSWYVDESWTWEETRYLYHLLLWI